MMCSLGRHQLGDDIPAPKIRARRRPRPSRKDLQAARTKLTKQLQEDIHQLDDGQAAAQDQFAMEFEPLPPGVSQVGDDQPAEKLPYWANMP
jgi:hypothetical protein